jgi:hypothetical protein
VKLFSRPRKAHRAAVFGCGPAGLFAAHALAQRGWEFDIFSKRRRSEVYGAQYLHSPVPGLPEVKAELRYVFEGGTVEDYLMKVYGRLPPLGEFRWAQSTLSEEPRVSWDLRTAYLAAWELYFDRIVSSNITPEWLMGRDVTSVDLARYDVLISSIPAPALCREPTHAFNSQKIWALGDAPERGVFCPVPCEPGVIVYNASRDTGWYRASNVFGYKTAEWPEARRPPLAEIAEVTKPLATSCTCWLDHPRFLRVGRYGTWDKAQHTHHAYQRTLELIS